MLAGGLPLQDLWLQQYNGWYKVCSKCSSPLRLHSYNAFDLWTTLPSREDCHPLMFGTTCFKNQPKYIATLHLSLLI